MTVVDVWNSSTSARRRANKYIVLSIAVYPSERFFGILMTYDRKYEVHLPIIRSSTMALDSRTFVARSSAAHHFSSQEHGQCRQATWTKLVPEPRGDLTVHTSEKESMDQILMAPSTIAGE